MRVIQSSSWSACVWAVFAAVAGALFASPAAAGPITDTTYFPTPQEQYVVALVNQARSSATGLQIVSHLVTNDFNTITASSGPRAQDGTPWSTDFWTSDDPNIANNMNTFHVDPGDLKAQFQSLTLPNSPLAWHPKLGNVANQYNGLMIADAGQTPNPHAIPPYDPYPGNPSRYSDGGYTGGAVAENAFRDYFLQGSNSAVFSFAAFMIDWGGAFGGDGIQDPTGHRDTLLSTTYRDIGVSIRPGYDAGADSSIQEFGVRPGVSTLTGLVYTDANNNSFFDAGEGIGSVTIGATPTGGGSPFNTATWSAGGYSLDLANGSYNVTASSPSFGTIPLGVATINNQNVERNLVNPVPEPTSAALLTLAAVASLLPRRRTRRWYGGSRRVVTPIY